MSDPIDQLNEALAGRYLLSRELGRGGMATVYLAEDLKHHRKVAIKVLSAEIAKAIGPDRFLREIEIAARLTHPHIMPLHDSGAAAQRLYYVMPYVEGESLRVRLEREKLLPIEEALRLTREIAAALAHAHRHGLVHRDIKPENILLADGLALVADFGIARALSVGDKGGLTTAGAMLGTPTYMPPEQALGSVNLDGRADLYSLGCVLYEMLAGQPPFTGPTAESVLYQHLSVEPGPVTDLRPSVSRSLADAVAKSLAKLPADRFSTAAGFAEALSLATIDGATPTPVPPGTEAAIPNNLPKQRSSFVGREKELAECARLLGETRLLTLTGVGGCGKTRLALLLAETLRETYPDGVWFIDLAPLSEPERVVQAVGTAIGVREEPGRQLAETLTRSVANQRMLLVLDNCEHLLEACGALADGLLGAASDLRIVATSREVLGIEGERSFGVGPLPLPAVDAPQGLDAIGSSDAVRLFVNRARLAAPEFVLNAQTAIAVAEICRRLDGLPLAIELAATRVKILSLEQIRTKLDDRFRLLTGGHKALPRHQTLRAAIQWSYDYLSLDEQGLFRALAVFAGGWTLEGAAALADVGADEFEVMDLLTHLVDKSLVVVERDISAEPRYRMLETVKQYAQERLDESGEGDAARTRHLDFYLALVERAEPSLEGGSEEVVWLTRFEREHENLLAAIAWSGQSEGGGEKGLRLTGAAASFWFIRGYFSLGREMLREVLSRGSSAARTHPRAKGLLQAGRLALLQHDFASTKALLEESLILFRELGDNSGMGRSIHYLGFMAFDQGDYRAARALYEESLALYREAGDTRRFATMLHNLASLETEEGDYPSALSHLEQSLALNREMGNKTQIAFNLAILARGSLKLGRLAEVGAHLAECLARVRVLGHRRLGAVALQETVQLAMVLGESDRAARLDGAGEALREAIGAPEGVGPQADRGVTRTRIRNELGEERFTRLAAEGRSLSFEAAVNSALEWLEGLQPQRTTSPGSDRSP